VSAIDLRGAMGRFATGVTVVTTRDEDGAPLGTTASAVASASLDPPLVLVCLAYSSQTLAALRRHEAFALNVLGAEQGELALAFAQPGPCESWGDEPPAIARTGAPLLDAAIATLDCAVHEILPGGDHAIVLGRVLHTDVPEEPREPLVTYRSRLEALPVA
jgi:3-hydroxy-9,10-secoandrosta-1,3,5(10)-triene-9,17-dione monooxygenase reductase component